MSDPVIYTAVLPTSRATVQHIAALLLRYRLTVGTRTGRRVLGVFAHAVLICRFLINATRVTHLARDNGMAPPPPTATCTRPWTSWPPEHLGCVRLC